MLTLGSISFNEDELDYETNGGSPVIVSSFSSAQVFDSYLISNGTEYKLYRPTPNNILISYKANIICDRTKLKSINSLIFEQAKIIKEYRINKDSSKLKGFNLKYDEENIDTYVWITSFSVDSSYFDTDTQSEKLRCKIDLQETE